jgi:ribosomal protein S1
MIANRRSNVLTRPDHKIVDRTKILDVDPTRRRITLSHRQAVSEP